MATVHTEEHGHGHGDEHAHSPHLHHHFETPVQQFESDKLGMWLFLATEILLFGGLFCAYSVYRHNHSEVFVYAHQFLNKKLGAANTIVLLFSSFTMAWSISAIQQGRKMLCAALLVITLMCAATFMVIKAFEYTAKIEHGLLWGSRYHPHHEGVEGAEGASAPGETRAVTGSAANGGAIAMGESTETKQNTAIPVQDKPALGVSEQAPPAQVDKQDMASAAAKASAPEADGEKSPDVSVQGKVTESGTANAQPLLSGSTEVSNTVSPPGVAAAEVPADFSYPSSLKLEPSKIKPAALPPAGIVEGKPAAPKEIEPRNVQTFFAIYFAMTGLHGIHVLIGMIVITIMLIKVLKNEYNAEYWTPIDLTGLYWHVVDLIWIFLFPLLYLIAK
jgi:cytochrome c oxidase subunit 3